MPATTKASKTVKLSVVPPLAAGVLAGCGEEEVTENAYCVTPDDVVVENRYCDDDYDGGGGGFIWFFTGSSFSSGSRVTGTAGEKIRAADRAALAKKGGFGSTASRSPGTGRVASYTASGGS